MHNHLAALVAGSLLAGTATSAIADVTISSAATANISCANGICVPTSTDAVLNVGDLENLLAAGNVEVTTTGSGVQASDIALDASLTWANTSDLALDAWHSIAIESQLSVTGQGGLSFTINDGGKNGELSFDRGGDLTFQNLASQLTIEGNSYTLVNSISALASAVAANPEGNYALANNYDASGDGTYTQSPIPTTFYGRFEGAGNTISNLTLRSKGGDIGFFAQTQDAQLSDFGLRHLHMRVNRASVGGLIGNANGGTVEHVYSTGVISSGTQTNVGGLVGFGTGTLIQSCYSSVTIEGGYAIGGVIGFASSGTIIELTYANGNIVAKSGLAAGALAGDNYRGTISQSYATGGVFLGKKGVAGGLVGVNDGTITNTYSTGAVSGDWVGGLIGANERTVSDSYSTGAVSGIARSIGIFSQSVYEGGLIGSDQSRSGSISNAYWDTTTSGISNLSQGAGNIANDPGIVGLTTAQLQSGLPEGFKSKIWREKANVNGGLPYLIANPPAK